MADKKIHFPVDLDYDEYTYYRVEFGKHSEFGKIRDIIIENAKSKKPTPEKLITRFFTLLQDVSSEEYRYYSPFIERAIDHVSNYFKKYPKYYFEREYYYWDNKKRLKVSKPKKETQSIRLSWSNSFRDMMEFVIPMLISLDKENRMDANKCMYNAFLLLAFYRNNLMSGNSHYNEQLRPYNLSVIAGYITVNIFEFDILNSNIPAKFIVNDHYNQVAKYQKGLVMKKYKYCFEKEQKQFPPISYIFPKKDDLYGGT